MDVLSRRSPAVGRFAPALVWAAALWATVLAAPTAALAQQAAEPPHTLFQQAVRRYADGQMQQARQLLLRARGTASGEQLIARIELYLGLVAAVQEQLPGARQHFKEALRASSNSTAAPTTASPAARPSVNARRGRAGGGAGLCCDGASSDCAGRWP